MPSTVALDPDTSSLVAGSLSPSNVISIRHSPSSFLLQGSDRRRALGRPLIRQRSQKRDNRGSRGEGGEGGGNAEQRSLAISSN
jgi:hypothetical protein